MASITTPVPTWLDCDPGHDDAVAILKCLYSSGIDIQGISAVYGNASLDATTRNLCRLVASYASEARAASLRLLRGASRPLVKPPVYAEDIHGADGLVGIQGLLPLAHPHVQRLYTRVMGDATPVEDALAEAIARLESQDKKLTIAATGTLTNVALFIQKYPHLIPRVAQIVIMGGVEGARGNKTPVAEFNIWCDPEAAQTVFNADVPVVMCGLNATHQAIYTPQVDAALRKRHSHLRTSLTTMLNAFGETYRNVFAFKDGPPVHDPLTITWITHPHIFQGQRYHVDVETHSGLTRGMTVCDVWNYKTDVDDSWGASGRNVRVLHGLDVAAFWDLFAGLVDAADSVCYINAASV